MERPSMEEKLKKSTSPAAQATLALMLFLGIGTPLGALLSVSWVLFAPIGGIYLSKFTFSVLMGACVPFLGFYGYWNWKNFRFYQTMLDKRRLVGGVAASLVLAGILWGMGIFYYPGALIPTIYRRDLWLDGNFIWAAIAALYLFIGWCLPLAVSIRQKAHWNLALSAAFIGLGAIVFGVLALGMIAEPFKYFSLSASSDRSSPQWSFSYAIETFAGIALLLVAAASVCRIALYSRFSGVPLRPELLSAVKRGIVGCLFFLIVWGVGGFCGTLFIQSVLHRSPEYRKMMELRKSGSESPKIEWRHFQPLQSSILSLSFQSRFACFKDEVARKDAESLLQQYPELLHEADSLCAQRYVLQLCFDSEDEPFRNIWQNHQLHRIARLQTFRLLLALEREEFAEVKRLRKLLQNLIMVQGDFVMLAQASHADLFFEQYLNVVEIMLNTPSLPPEELLLIKQTMPEWNRQLKHCMELASLGIQINYAAELERVMNVSLNGISLKNWSWVIPGLWFVLNSNRYYALTTSEAACETEALLRLIQRGEALGQAVNFLLDESGASPPVERTGKITRNLLYMRNDGASPLAIEHTKINEKRTYRQFGPNESNILLLK